MRIATTFIKLFQWNGNYSSVLCGIATIFWHYFADHSLAQLCHKPIICSWYTVVHRPLLGVLSHLVHRLRPLSAIPTACVVYQSSYCYILAPCFVHLSAYHGVKSKHNYQDVVADAVNYTAVIGITLLGTVSENKASPVHFLWLWVMNNHTV